MITVEFKTSFNFNINNGYIRVEQNQNSIELSITKYGYGPMEQGASNASIYLTEEEFIDLVNAMNRIKKKLI